MSVSLTFLCLTRMVWCWCTHWCRNKGASVIIISGRAQVQDRVTGLELGATDYIAQPFDPAEVVACVRARLRGTRMPKQSENPASFNGWTVHFCRYVPTDETAEEIPLLQAKGEVLHLFFKSPKRLISRMQMQQKAWRCCRGKL